MSVKYIFNALVIFAFFAASSSYAVGTKSKTAKAKVVAKVHVATANHATTIPVVAVEETGPQDEDDEEVSPYEGAGMSVDDPGAPEKGEVEVKLVGARSRASGGVRGAEQEVEVAYGVEVLGRPAEIAVAQGYSKEKSTDEEGVSSTSRETAPTEVGLKINVYDNQKTSVSAATGLGYAKDHVAIPLIISKEFGPVALVGQVEYEKPLNVHYDEDGVADKNPELTAGFAIGRRLSPKMTIMADVTRTSQASDLHADKVVWVDVGLFRKVTKNINVFIRAGKTVGYSADGNQYVTVAGIEVAGSGKSALKSISKFFKQPVGK